MKVRCPGCGHEAVVVLASGRYEHHYPPVKRVGYDPLNVKFCDLSGKEPANLEELKQSCPKCGKKVIPNDDGSLPRHYPDPSKTFSADNYCGLPGDDGVRATVMPKRTFKFA